MHSDPGGPERDLRFGLSNQLPDDNDAFSTKDLVFRGVTNHIRPFSYLLIPLTGFGPGGQISPIGLAWSIKNGTPLSTESARSASGQEITAIAGAGTVPRANPLSCSLPFQRPEI